MAKKRKQDPYIVRGYLSYKPVNQEYDIKEFGSVDIIDRSDFIDILKKFGVSNFKIEDDTGYFVYLAYSSSGTTMTRRGNTNSQTFRSGTARKEYLFLSSTQGSKAIVSQFVTINITQNILDVYHDPGVRHDRDAIKKNKSKKILHVGEPNF